MDKKIEDQIGIKTYPLRKSGGQHVGMMKGIRLWYPKDSKDPLVDIRVNTERSQYKNKNIALAMMELILEDL